jgi:hypothetical protein
MTKEELLQPRYKVIADWPGSPLRIGCILQDDVESCFIIYPDGSKDLTSSYVWRNKANYPHLFKKLEWWEERDEKDFPKYIKSKTTGKVLRAVFGRAYKWDNILPATEEEFINQNTLQNQ